MGPANSYPTGRRLPEAGRYARAKRRRASRQEARGPHYLLEPLLAWCDERFDIDDDYWDPRAYPLQDWGLDRKELERSGLLLPR